MQIQISWLLRSQLIWIYTVCKSRAYHPGSAGLGLIWLMISETIIQILCSFEPWFLKVLYNYSVHQREEWLGEAKVSYILHHRGLQLILAYSWARPAILAAGKGIAGMFLFLLFLHFHSFSFLPCFSLSSPLLSLLSLFSLSVRVDTKWPTRKGQRVVKPQLNQSINLYTKAMIPHDYWKCHANIQFIRAMIPLDSWKCHTHTLFIWVMIPKSIIQILCLL